MNLESVNALAQLLAAIGVIASLFYLAVQIRQNTLSMRAITRRTAQAFAQARFVSWIQAAISSAPSRLTTRIEGCDAVIRVYDKAGNLIETHEQAGDFLVGSLNN